MWRAEVRNGYVYVIDTNTGEERHIPNGGTGQVLDATVTGDDEVTIKTDYYGGFETRYRISTGHRAD